MKIIRIQAWYRSTIHEIAILQWSRKTFQRDPEMDRLKDIDIDSPGKLRNPILSVN